MNYSPKLHYIQTLIPSPPPGHHVRAARLPSGGHLLPTRLALGRLRGRPLLPPPAGAPRPPRDPGGRIPPLLDRGEGPAVR